MSQGRLMNKLLGGLLVMLMLGIGAATLVPVNRSNATGPAQPTQPPSGPGGADYAHADWIVNSGGSGDDAWYVFQPTSPKPARSRPGYVRAWSSG